MNVQTIALRALATLLVAFNCVAPAQARFLETDPVGYVDNMNLYVYVGNDSLNKTDPTGRQEFEAFATDAYRQRLEDRGISVEQQVKDHPSQAALGVVGGIIVGGLIVCVAECGPAFATLATRAPVTLDIAAAAGDLPALPAAAGTAGLIAAGNKIGDKLADTLSPGPFAGGSIPARGPTRDFTSAERAAIGTTSGCHTCGTTVAGTKTGHFVPDHQPPSALVPPGTPQQLFPHCIGCSTTQMRQVLREMQKPKRGIP